MKDGLGEGTIWKTHPGRFHPDGLPAPPTRGALSGYSNGSGNGPRAVNEMCVPIKGGTQRLAVQFEEDHNRHHDSYNMSYHRDFTTR